MNSTLKFFGFSTPNSKKKEEPLAESTLIASTPQNDPYRGKRRTASPLSNKNQQKMKIESHVLTDAQSSGIVSRLVKYYDQSQNDAAERSRIVYNKVGDFPLVQLKKNEIKRSISKATSVRIAPPNRTIMNRDLRAAIMRSNSFQFGSGIPKIQPVKMRAKDDSHQIITNHEPLNEEAYPASSNSVLDALEKNCRKRINNEELILDRSKKFCPPAYEQPAPLPPQSQNNVPVISTPQSAKRTREPSSPNKKVPSFDFQQRAKKLRTRNNALLSSLSSSHHELIPSTPPSSPQIKPKAIQMPKPFINKSPVTITTQEKEKTPVEEEKKKSAEKEVPDAPQEQPKTAEIPKKLQLFNRKPDPNAVSNRAKFRLYDSDEEDEVHIKFVKPKEQPVEGNDDRKELEKAKLAKMLDCLTKGTKSPFAPKEKSKDTVDAIKPAEEPKTSQAASISFTTSTTTAIVAPLTSSGNTSVTSTSVKDVQTSSSGSSSGFQLSTGISLTKPSEKDDKGLEIPGIKPLIPTSTASIAPISIPVSKENEPEKVSTSSSALTAAGGIKFTFGAQLKPQESEKPSLPIPSIATSQSSEKSSLGGFQFGSNLATPASTSSLTVTTSLPQAVSKPVSPLALFSSSGNSNAPQSTGNANKIESITATTTASGVGFSFGGIKPISTTSVAPSASFSFGAKPTEVTTAPPSFNFGSNTIVTTTAQQQAPQLESKPSFSFGGNSIAPTPSFAKPEAPKSSFSFGTSSQPASSTPIFGQLSASNTASPATTASSGFNFGSNAITSSNSFGSNAAVTSTNTFGSNAITSTNTFGSNAITPSNSFNQLSSAPSFTSLNQPVPSTAPPTFGTFSSTTTTSNSIFGSVNTNTQQPSSVFGGFNANTSTTSSPFTTSTQQSTFGIQSEQPKSTFSFGQANAAPSVTSSSIFDSTQAPAKPSFNFGSNLSAQPSFGGINSAPSQETKPAFNFNSSSNAPPAFGSQGAVASAPVFGSTQSPFGSSQDAQKPAFNFTNPNSSSFNFNKPQENSSPFGGVQSQQSDKPAFNFGGAAPQLPQMSPSPAFNIGTAGQQRKPFRTAARRFK